MESYKTSVLRLHLGFVKFRCLIIAHTDLLLYSSWTLHTLLGKYITFSRI